MGTSLELLVYTNSDCSLCNKLTQNVNRNDSISYFLLPYTSKLREGHVMYEKK